ncbi:MAG TPA: thioredoxin family protein [Candidatus Omnitrophota bacterium]|nr:thioredoxin family protein [Candidatus Omnitrophota bacterium]HPS36351.1 thioredoxin family protein [Candidatus Omnitrophota bacterium]
MNKKKFLILFVAGFFLSISAVYAAAFQPKKEQSPKAAPASAPAQTPAPAPVVPPPPSWSEGWYSGAAGYTKALAEYEKTNRPMAIYISVAWCPYCRAFEKEVLSSPWVREFLKDKIKVNINPESSRQENAIAFQYGVTGFPSFYVHPPQPSGTVRLPTGVSSEKFVQTFEQALK